MNADELNRRTEQGGVGMKTNWNPMHYISDYGWTCIVSVASLVAAAAVLAG